MTSRFARPFWGALLTGLFAVSASAPAAAAPPPTDAEWGEARILDLVNHTRRSHGLGTVQRHPGADLMGQWSANVQAWVGQLGHNANLAHDVTVAVTPDWSWAGENVGCGRDADHLVAMWMASPGHRAVILRPGADTIGLGAIYARECLWATAVYIDT